MTEQQLALDGALVSAESLLRRWFEARQARATAAELKSRADYIAAFADVWDAEVEMEAWCIRDGLTQAGQTPRVRK